MNDEERLDGLAKRLASDDKKEWLSLDEFLEFRVLSSKIYGIELIKPLKVIEY